MRFTDGFRLAELAAGDDARRARGQIAASLREAIESSEPQDRERKMHWLRSVTTALGRPPATTDVRVAAILGAPSTHSPRRRYRPAPGLRQHMTRWLRTAATSVRAAREIAELEGRWDE